MKRPRIPDASRLRLDLVGAAAAGFALMVPVLLSSGELVGSGTDMLTDEVPHLAFALRWIRQGILPLWNPFIYDGVPFPAGTQGYFYPPAWLALIVSLSTAIKLLLALHLALAGAGAAWLCRPYVRSRIASGTGGALFATCGFFTAHVFAGHMKLVEAAAYVPWIVALVDRARRRERLAWAPAGLCFALAMLAARYQMVAIGALAAALFAFAQALVEDPALPLRSRVASAGRAVAALLLLLAMGGLVGAVQLLPVAATLPFTQRHAVDASFAGSFASPPGDFLAMLLPNAFGSGADAPFVGDFTFWEAFAYVGLPTIAIATVAVACLPRRRWLGPAVVAAIGAMLSVGDGTPLLRVLCTLAPPFAQFRGAGRYLVVVALFAALLAALGLDAFLAGEDLRLARGRGRVRRLAGPSALAGIAGVAFLALAQCTPADYARFAESLVPTAPSATAAAWAAVLAQTRTDATLAVVLLGATVGVLAWATEAARRPRAAWALCALAVLDTLHAAQRFLVTGPPDTFEWMAPLAEGCRKAAGLGGRILTTPELVAPNAGAPYDLASLEGYSIFVDDRYARFFNRSEGAPLDRFISPVLTAGASSLLRPLGTSVVLTTLPIVDAKGHAQLGIGGFHVIGGMGPRLRVLAADDPVPRAALVHRIESVPDEAATYARMEQPAFDVARVALVEVPADSVEAEAPRSESERAQELARISTYEPNRVVVDVNAAAAGLLVLSDGLEPGWTARVDDAPARLLHVNRVMRGVPVAAGRHRVLMTYQPPGWTAGVGLSLAGLAGSIAIAVVDRRRRRARATSRSPAETTR